MQLRRTIGQAAVFGIVVLSGTAGLADDAAARSRSASHFGGHHGGFAAAAHGRHGHGYSIAHYYGGGLQCVPFARENTGIELAGNAANWWEAAEGVYQRGARPEVGSVLNFRANGRMRLGHVAVVSNVIDSRNIEIDHANWSGHGGIGRNINVIDVSPGNDWSAVRVALGSTGDYGSVYPTYGFIYDRPDHGTMLANNTSAPARALPAAPRDLRPFAEQDEIASNIQDDEEVAEAADDAPRMRRVSHHGSRRDAYASREYGSRHLISRSSHETYGAIHGRHGAVHEAYGRAPVMRTDVHEAGVVHAHHTARRRT